MARPTSSERTHATWRQELHAPEGPVDEYSCPVCGIELAKSNFETPERDYSCPYCSTRRTPSVVRASELALPEPDFEAEPHQGRIDRLGDALSPR